MKNVLVIGASGGMGQEVVKKFIDANFNVYGLDINTFSYPRFKGYKVDIKDEKSIINAYNQISQEIDSLYAIISVVGIYHMDSLLEIDDQKLKDVLDINVLGPQRVIKIFYPLLKKDSRIFITTSELATYDPLPFNGIYSMSKSLLEKYAYSLRMEINQFGIKVITYRPGAVKTNLLGVSTKSLDEFIVKTKIHKTSSKKFKRIVDSVECKAISASLNAKIIYRIVNKKHPRYSYSKNRNIGLVFLNLLPQSLQTAIISKIIS